MAFQIIQTWFHFEEIYYPYFGRRVRQVCDILTNEKTYEYKDLNNKNFLGLKVIARNNLNKEISFIEERRDGEYVLLLNFDPLDQYPTPHQSILNIYPFLKTEERLKHIKIEIDYILSEIEEDIQEDLSLKERLFQKICPINYFTLSMGGRIQPEFYITLPKGYRIRKGFFQKKHKSIEGGDVEMTCQQYKRLSDGTREKESPLEVDPPFIKNNFGSRTYNYLINDSDYKQTNIDSEYYDLTKYQFTYSASPYEIIIGVSLIPFLFHFLSSILLMGVIFHLNDATSQLKYGSQMGMSYLIVLLSFAYYYANLTNDDYNIPNRMVFIPTLGFSIIVCFLLITLGK